LAKDSLDFVQRGKVSIVRRQYAEAVKICRLGLLAHPTLLEGRLVLGMALTALARWDEVLAEMRVALETDPHSALAWLLKGEALVGKGDYAQAEATLRRAKELDPSNSKADQLLAEIEIARAAGIDGQPAEQTDTRVYPAKAGESEKLSLREPSSDIGLVYEDDEATEVDPEPGQRVRRLQELAGQLDAPGNSPAGGTDIADTEDRSTETFLPPGAESSYEGPALDDYAERARPKVASLAEDTGPGATPIEPHRRVTMDPAGTDSIELTSGEISIVEQPPSIADDDDEDEADTRQRRRRGGEVDDEVGTRPETPDLLRHRRPAEVDRDRAEPRSARPPQRKRSNPFEVVRDEVPPPPAREADLPTVVPRDDESSLWSRIAGALDLDRLRSGGIGILVAALVAAIAAGVVAGLLVREWRMRARVARRHELARQKLQSGNYPGFQSAELLYRQILSERDDPPARALRARTLAQMAFEFGDGTESATRAVAGLGDAGSEEAEEARIYLAMARGDGDKALRDASALRRKYADAPTTYLYGRAELLTDRPQVAVDALRAVAELEPRDALAQHALGVVEAALKHDDRAVDAYRRALTANSNHIATIIDRALLHARRGTPEERDQARGALIGVIDKLAADCSAGQLARAHLGLGELELWKGNLAAARKELDAAAEKRREGDVTLAEELARGYLRAFALDEADREARRALSVGSRLGPRLVLAEVLLRRGRPQQAVEVINEQGATRPEALVVRSLGHLQLGHKDAARIDAEAALRVQPDLVGAKIALARVELAEGKLERAQRDLERLDRVERSAEVSTALGLVYAAARLPDRARATLREAIARDPLSQEARLSLAAMLREAERWDEAADELKQLLALNPAYRPARVEAARLAMVKGDMAAARDLWDALAKEDPDCESLLGAARAHVFLGDAAGAVERVQKTGKACAGMLDPDEVNELLARAWLMERRPADVVALLRKGPPSALRGPLLPLLMNAYLDLDEPERAREVMSLSPLRARSTTEALVARGRLAIEGGRDLTAESLAAAALGRLRTSTAPPVVKSQALLVLGRSQWEQGDFRPALKSLDQAVQLDPGNARAWYYQALVDDDLKKRDEAKKALETAVQLDPRYPDALYLLGRFRSDGGDPKAQDAWRAYLEAAPKGLYADEVRRALEGGAPAPRTKRPKPIAAQKPPAPPKAATKTPQPIKSAPVKKR
jgi:tetratricopeptide (TPR) repeat protein